MHKKKRKARGALPHVFYHFFLARERAGLFGRRRTRGKKAAGQVHYNILWFGASPHRYNSVYPSGSFRDPSNHHRSRFRLAVHAAHRAASARAVGLYSEIWPPDDAGGEDPRAAPGRHHPVGRTEERVRRRRAGRAIRRSSTSGTPVLGICYGMQLMAHSLGGRVAPAPQREFGHATVTITGTPGRRGALFADVPAEIRVWASHGDFVAAAPAGFSVVATSANAPIAAMADPAARSTRFCFIRRSCTPKAASRSSATSRTASAAAPATGRWRRLSRRRRREDPRAGRRRPRRLRAERRRRLDGGRAHHPSRDRRQADLHLRRQRRPAARRGGADSQAVRAAASCRSCSWTRRRCFSIGWPASPIREQKRKIIGATFIDVFEEEAAKLGAGRFSRAGHALSRRDRIGVDRRPVGDDQEPPQRRRPARADAHEAGRAAARAVQGRSARGRPQAGPRRGVRRAAAVSRPGPRRADSRRGHAAAPRRCCGAPTRSSPKK